MAHESTSVLLRKLKENLRDAAGREDIAVCRLITNECLGLFMAGMRLSITVELALASKEVEDDDEETTDE